MRWDVTGWTWDVPMVYTYHRYTWFTVFATFFKFLPHHPLFSPHPPIFSSFLYSKPTQAVWLKSQLPRPARHVLPWKYRGVWQKYRGVWQKLEKSGESCKSGGEWLSTHGTGPVVFAAGTWSSVLMAVQIHYKFTSASVALAILQVLNQRINSRTTDCSPLITIISPK